MLLLDLSAIVISNVVHAVTVKKIELSTSMVRNIVLWEILKYRKKYRKYGEVVICADAKHYWRKDKFPHYKQNRKKMRSESKMDWEAFYVMFNTVKQEIKETFGYTFVEVDNCEADDIIAVLAMRYSAHEDIMIVSSDKDMIQIQLKTKGNVKQYSPAIKKLLTKRNNDYSLIEHYIRGDSSDGIPNILSDDDVFMCAEKRQKSISAMMIEDAKRMKNPEYICPNADALDKYKRNRELIDIDYIPDDLRKQIVAEYERAKTAKMGNLRNYFIKHRLKNLFPELGAF